MIPIVLTAYNRVDTLTKTINSLLKCDGIEDRDIIVYQDGMGEAGCDEWRFTKAYLDVMAIIRFRSSTIIKTQSKHLGLRGNSLKAINKGLRGYDKIIFIQDDMEFGKDFLTFMDYSLNKYEDRKDIMFVSGYSHINWDACYLSPLIADGLGIWRSKWETPHLSGSPNYRAYEKYTTPSFASFLKDIYEGKSDAFMALLAYQMYLNEARCLHPSMNKVRYCVSDSTNSKKRDSKKLNNKLYGGFFDTLDETEIPHNIIRNTKNYRWSMFKEFTRWLRG